MRENANLKDRQAIHCNNSARRQFPSKVCALTGSFIETTSAGRDPVKLFPRHSGASGSQNEMLVQAVAFREAQRTSNMTRRKYPNGCVSGPTLRKHASDRSGRPKPRAGSKHCARPEAPRPPCLPPQILVKTRKLRLPRCGCASHAPTQFRERPEHNSHSVSKPSRNWAKKTKCKITCHFIQRKKYPPKTQVTKVPHKSSKRHV